MTDQRSRQIAPLVILVSIGLLGLSLSLGMGAGVATGATTGSSDVPVTVQHTFTGTSAESEHAVAVTLTVAPTPETGAINNTSIQVTSTSAAFLAPTSISTSETAGGDQIITQSNAQPAEFQLARLEPGETVTLRFRLHPKAVVPNGDSLANVHIQTQFEQNQREASTTKTIAPVVDESQLAFTVAPAISPLLAGGIGATVGMLLVGSVAYVLRRRRRASLGALLRPAKANTVNADTKRAIEQALVRLGVDSTSDTSRPGGEPPGGRGDTTTAREVPNDRGNAGSTESDSGDTVMIDFDD
jgi:hypothetical protein